MSLKQGSELGIIFFPDFRFPNMFLWIQIWDFSAWIEDFKQSIFRWSPIPNSGIFILRWFFDQAQNEKYSGWGSRIFFWNYSDLRIIPVFIRRNRNLREKNSVLLPNPSFKRLRNLFLPLYWDWEKEFQIFQNYRRLF